MQWLPGLNRPLIAGQKLRNQDIHFAWRCQRHQIAQRRFVFFVDGNSRSTIHREAALVETAMQPAFGQAISLDATQGQAAAHAGQKPALYRKALAQPGQIKIVKAKQCQQYRKNPYQQQEQKNGKEDTGCGCRSSQMQAVGPAEKQLHHRIDQLSHRLAGGLEQHADTGQRHLDEFAVPFFLFSEADLKLLQPGWDEWLAARGKRDYESEDDQSFFLRSLAAARQQDAELQREIALMQLTMQTIQAGVTSLWEVTLYPAAGQGGPPLWVVVTGRDSNQATFAALEKNPGYVAGPVRRVSRRTR